MPHPRSPFVRRPLVALLALATLSACGSTVPLSQQQASSAVTNDGSFPDTRLTSSCVSSSPSFSL